MTRTEIRELLEREPFKPFRVRLTSGEAHEIRDPHLAVAMKTELFIAAGNSDRWTLIPYLHVASIQHVGNGNGRSQRR